MVFYEVLELALEGCGTTLAAEEQSRGFRQRLAAEERLLERYPASSALGRELRRNQLYTGVLSDTHLFQSKKKPKMQRFIDEARRGTRLPDQCPVIRAWLQHLGILLATKAGETLSVQWQEAAKRWPELNPAEKKQMLDRVSRSLSGPSFSGSRLEAVWGNGPETVLPVHYGKNTPSCLGKAQVLAGFARLAGVTSFLYVPVVETADDAAPAIRDGSAALAAFLSEPGIATDFLTVRTLLTKHGEALQRIECPSWLHGIVAVPIAKDEWIIADPNLQRLDKATWGFALDDMVRSPRRRLRLPGVCLTDMSISRHQYPSLLHVLEDTIDAARKLNAELPNIELTPDSLIELIIKHELGKPLGAYCGAERNDSSVRAIKMCLAYLSGSDTVFKLQPSDEDLEHLLPNGEMLTLVSRRIAHATTYRCFKDIEERQNSNYEQRPFPIVEYGPAGYLLAIHTLAHLGANYGVSDTLEPVLASHCFSQWRTWYAACSLDPGSQPIARFAAEVMSHVYSDMRLHSATRGLGEVLARFQSSKALRFPIEEYSAWATRKNGQPRRSSGSSWRKVFPPTTSEKKDRATRQLSTS